MRKEGVLYPLRGGLPVPTNDCDRVLVYVYGNGDTDLLLREPTLARLAVAVGQIGIIDVGLINPYAILEHQAVLVSVHGCKDSMPPFEGGLVRYAAYLCDGIERHIEAHEVDEVYPGGEVFLTALKDGAGKRAEPRAAKVAAVTLLSRLAPTILERSLIATGRAAWVGPVQRGSLGEVAEPVLLFAAAFCYG